MRTRILAVVAVVLAAGVALANPAIVVTPAFITQALADARYLLLSGGTVTGQTTFTANPASTAIGAGTVLVNPAACDANEFLWGVGPGALVVGARATVDCEGDFAAASIRNNNTEWVTVGTGAFFYTNTTTYNLGMSATGLAIQIAATSPLYKTTTNCTDSAGAAACTAAPAGSVVIDATATTVTVSTTAVTANSQVFVMEDSSLETRLGLGTGGCNSTYARTYYVSARTAGTSFQITSSAAPITKPACLSYFIVN